MNDNHIIDYKLYIETNPEIRFGKPCIRGTRISVYDVLGWFASGMSQEEILEDFPQLTKENILACFAYILTFDKISEKEKQDVIPEIFYRESQVIETPDKRFRG